MRISNNTKRRALALVMAAAMALNLTVLPAFADDANAIPQASAYTETADSDAPDETNADDTADAAVSAVPAPAADTTADDSTPATTATPAPTDAADTVTAYAADSAPTNADTTTYADDDTSKIKNSDNLRDFVSDVEIEGADKEGNNYVLYPGVSYKFKLTFSESATRQMLTDGELIYKIPPQIQAIGDTSGEFSINIGGPNGETFTVDGNTFTINGDTLTVKINTNSENYEKLKSAANVQFWLAITGRIADDPAGDKIDFGNGEEVPAVYPKDATVSTKKDATSYDKKTGEVIYTVTVSSKGTATNVKVTDQITGTALNYVPGSLQVDGQAVAATSENNGGFEYTIPEIQNGQTITLT